LTDIGLPLHSSLTENPVSTIFQPNESSFERSIMASAWIRNHRRLIIVLAVVATPLCGWIGSGQLARFRIERHYQAVVQEADRLDPGWREGYQRGFRSPIPDEENSAILIESVVEKLPGGWTPLNGKWPPLVLNPAEPLPAEIATQLRQRRNEAASGLSLARSLADRPRGRFLESSSTGEFPNSVPIVRQMVERVAGLLYIDALIRIEETDFAGAARNLQAMVNAGRAVDDEPLLAIQAGRVNAVVPAVANLERLLAQGELPGAVLADLQKLLEDEARHPLALLALRGDRAIAERMIEQVHTGSRGFATLFDVGAPPGFLYSWTTLRENQARLLEGNTQFVEVAKLPAEQQGPAFRRLLDVHSQRWNQSGILDKIYTFPFHDLHGGALVVGAWHTRHRTQLKLAILALASERYRVDHGRWPATPAELVPAYLSTVPFDPHEGVPLHWKTTGDNLILYSVGENGIDDGGIWPRGNPYHPNQDEGFRLDAPATRLRRPISKP
jgi:hypothetical protein